LIFHFAISTSFYDQRIWHGQKKRISFQCISLLAVIAIHQTNVNAVNQKVKTI